MRSRNSLLLVGLIVTLSCSFVLFGCSNDDSPTNITIIDDTQTLEEMLGEVAQQVDQHLDSIVTSMENGLSVAVYSDNGGSTDIGDIMTGSVIPDSTLTRDEWIVSYSTDLQAGLGSLTMVDSLTYVVHGNISESPAGATEMYFVHNYNFKSLDTTQTFSDIDLRGYFHITSIQSDTAVVNGTFTALVTDKRVSANTTTWTESTFETTLNNVRVAGDGSSFDTGCPCDGTIDISLEYLNARDLNVPTITAWNFDVTADNGVVNVDVSTGNLSSSYQQILCTP